MPSRNEIKEFQQKLENQQQEVINLRTELSSVFTDADDAIVQIDTADIKNKNIRWMQQYHGSGSRLSIQ